MKRKITFALVFLLLIGLVNTHSTFEVGAADNQTSEAYAFEKNLTHTNAGWKTTSIGAVTFDAPSKWFVEQGVYSPGMQDNKNFDFNIAVGYNEDGSVEYGERRIKEEFDDGYEDDTTVDGHYAKFMMYTYNDVDTGTKIVNYLYLIQLSTNGGVCALLYSAPAATNREFLDDYYVVVESLKIDASKLPKISEKSNIQPKTSTQSYVANTNTGKFHYPYCSSVSKMSEKNKLYYEGSRDELISAGYQPCKRCNP